MFVLMQVFLFLVVLFASGTSTYLEIVFFYFSFVVISNKFFSTCIFEYKFHCFLRVCYVFPLIILLAPVLTGSDTKFFQIDRFLI